jgi:predicted RNA-binding protein associated with RNAse of E/G family
VTDLLLLAYAVNKGLITREQYVDALREFVKPGPFTKLVVAEARAKGESGYEQRRR